MQIDRRTLLGAAAAWLPEPDAAAAPEPAVRAASKLELLVQVFGHLTGLLAALFVGAAIVTLWWALPKMLKRRGAI